MEKCKMLGKTQFVVPSPEKSKLLSELELIIMKDLIRVIAQALVDNPDQVIVTEIAGGQTSVLELKVEKEDIGKIIGKKGRTADALRTILSAASAKIKRRTVLEILD